MGNNIGKELRLARLNAGLTQLEVAHLAGVDVAILSRIETGHVLPGPNMEQVLKQVTGWTEALARIVESGQATRQKVR